MLARSSRPAHLATKTLPSFTLRWRSRKVIERSGLERAVLSQFTSARPCDRKANKPPGAEALAARAVLLGDVGVEPSVDLDRLAELVHLAFPGTLDLAGEVSA